MKLGAVLRKERERKRIAIEAAAVKVGSSLGEYQEIESGASSIEEWGPRIAEIAIKLATPTSRLISETGKSTQAAQREGQCGDLVTKCREGIGLTRDELAARL